MNRCPRCGMPPDGTNATCSRCLPGERRIASAPTAAAAGVVTLLRRLETVLGAGAFLLVTYLLGTSARLIPELEVRVMPGSARAATEFLVEPIAANPPPPFVLELADGDVIDIRTGDHFAAPFEVSDPRPCTLTAQVLGLAGGSRDVEVYVLDEDGYDDWQNGVRPHALFESGRASLASLEVDLPRRGRYHLLLSNRYSIFTPKRVRVDGARLRCA